jgi:hypothetical protein
MRLPPCEVYAAKMAVHLNALRVEGHCPTGDTSFCKRPTAPSGCSSAYMISDGLRISSSSFFGMVREEVGYAAVVLVVASVAEHSGPDHWHSGMEAGKFCRRRSTCPTNAAHPGHSLLPLCERGRDRERARKGGEGMEHGDCRG